MLLILQFDFPISPSDLPWWGWLLCAAVVIIIAFRMISTFNDAPIGFIIAMILWLVAGLLALTGIVGMVKWMGNG